MQDAPFDWPAIGRASAIIFGSAAAFGLIVPLAGALLVNEIIPAQTDWTTLNISGSMVYRLMYWVIAWALTFVMGQRLINEVHERIIDDMLVIAVVTSVLLWVMKFVVWLAYEPRVYDVNTPLGTPIFAITFIDVAGALFLIVTAFIAARVNQF